MGSTRRTVRWNGDSSLSSGRNGLGRSGRLSGHSRVPPPPAMITAYIRVILGGGRVVPAGGRSPRLLADDDELAFPDDPARGLVVAGVVERELAERHVALREGVAPE